MMDIAAPAVPALGDKIDTASEASSPHDHDNEKELDVEESGDLSRVSSKMSFDQHIGVTKIESLCE
jgi:hypothetical protein